MSAPPLVTVLLSTFNDAAWLPAAVQSILAQTLEDFELLLIDDGSTDASADYLATVTDRRLRIIRHAANQGLTRSLNEGLDAARGKYIARMDADDVALPERLREQAEYMEQNPQLLVLGSSRELIDTQGRNIGTAIAVRGDLSIRYKCLLGNPFAHPTVMLRRESLDAHGLRYDPRFSTAQDYELWTRLLVVGSGDNLRQSLLHYRLRDGISRLRRNEQLANHDQIALAACQRLLPTFTLTIEQIHQLRGRYGGHSVREPDMDPADRAWVGLREKMRDQFIRQYRNHPEMDEFIGSQ